MSLAVLEVVDITLAVVALAGSALELAFPLPLEPITPLPLAQAVLEVHQPQRKAVLAAIPYLALSLATAVVVADQIMAEARDKRAQMAVLVVAVQDRAHQQRVEPPVLAIRQALAQHKDQMVAQANLECHIPAVVAVVLAKLDMREMLHLQTPEQAAQERHLLLVACL